MQVATRFHGSLVIQEKDIITLDYEILGFPHHRHYILLPHRADSPFLYLQSTDTPELAFITIDPLLKVPDYRVPPEDVADLGDPKDWAVLCLCTIEGGQAGTMNLRSPLVINRQTRRGGQFILSIPYPFRYPLIGG